MTQKKIPIRKRLEKIEVRVTPEQKEQLKKRAEDLSIPITSYLKLKALDLLRDK